MSAFNFEREIWYRDHVNEVVLGVAYEQKIMCLCKMGAQNCAALSINSYGAYEGAIYGDVRCTHLYTYLRHIGDFIVPAAECPNWVDRPEEYKSEIEVMECIENL